MSIISNLIRIGLQTTDASPIDFTSLVPNQQQKGLGLSAEYFDMNASPRVFYVMNKALSGFDVAGGGGGSGGGAVASVNNKTGSVVLAASDVLAAPQASGTYNAATGHAFDVHNVDLGVLTAGTPAPVNAAFVVTNAPTPTTSSLSPNFTLLSNGDTIYFDSVNYVKVGVTAIGRATTAVQKGDGNSGGGGSSLIDAVPGADYMQGSILACNVPVAAAPDGTIGANGALTTSMVTVPGGGYNYGIWLLFPANVITGSNPAGFYYVVFSSSGAGTIYNNTYTPGINSGPGSWRTPTTLVPFVGTTGSAYTGTTAAVTTHSFVVPANSMGPNGVLRSEFYTHNNNSAGTKRVRQLAGSNTLGYDNSQTTNPISIDSCLVWNRGVTNVQESIVQGPALHANLSGNRGGIDTTANFTLTVQTTTSTTSDYVVVESLRVTPQFGA